MHMYETAPPDKLSCSKGVGSVINSVNNYY